LLIWLGGVAQADSASSTVTATILRKLDLPIGRGLGRNHKGNLAAFLNADRPLWPRHSDDRYSDVFRRFCRHEIPKCRLG
jgi:hypothetical protein